MRNVKGLVKTKRTRLTQTADRQTDRHTDIQRERHIQFTYREREKEAGRIRVE